MVIGVPKEIKSDEYRVALLPVGAHLLVEDGHSVLVETGAGKITFSAVAEAFPDLPV